MDFFINGHTVLMYTKAIKIAEFKSEVTFDLRPLMLLKGHQSGCMMQYAHHMDIRVIKDVDFKP